jgi:hypothetical protein
VPPAESAGALERPTATPSRSVEATKTLVRSRLLKRENLTVPAPNCGHDLTTAKIDDRPGA